MANELKSGAYQFTYEDTKISGGGGVILNNGKIAGRSVHGNDITGSYKGRRVSASVAAAVHAGSVAEHMKLPPSAPVPAGASFDFDVQGEHGGKGSVTTANGPCRVSLTFICPIP